MHDLDVIRDIERQIEIPLKKVTQAELLQNPNAVLRVYATDNNGNLTGLRLDYTGFADPALLIQQPTLKTLRLQGAWAISDFGFLKELKGLTTLKLDDNKISDGSFLKELKGLTTLYLRDNQISDGSFLKELKGLTTLSLYNNQISDGSFLKELKGLTTLYLSGNKISDWSFLKELKGLTTLYLRLNQISDGSFLKELKGLTTLDLSDNQVSDWSFLKEFKGLTTLDLSDNPISDGSFLKEFKGLTTLNLTNNQISDGSFLKELKGLTTLDLSSNNLTNLAFVASLSNLRNLYFDVNKSLNDPPEQVCKQGVAAIRSYYLQQEKAGKARIYEAKALLVGEPGAGKTSLLNKLLDHDYVVDPKKKHNATLGIDIRQNWEFNWTGDKSGNTKFKGHLWDFGGQDIQYYIHQFFLTEGSLYILLVDDRQDAQNIDYWLNIIKLLGKGSPVLLVRNQKNIKSVTAFDQPKYAKRYGEFFEISFCEVNLVADENDLRFQVIEEQAKKMLSTLPHVDRELPKTYVRVRQELEKRREARENHITLAEFAKICTDKSIPQEEDQQVLRRYLHQLGIILHYENDSTLADTVFLNPHWITKAVYSILSDKELENNGKFTKDWFFSKLPEPGYNLSERHKILLLMQKKEFELVYQLDSAEDTYLAPRLLPNKAPEAANTWQQQGALSFRYRYQFMPVGIINRLVVRLSSLIAEDEKHDDLVWQEGAILKKDNCRARIKEDITRDGLKVIDISVTGDSYERRQLLGHIRENLEGIHRHSFKGLEIEELVPCCCKICAEAEEPAFHEFSLLKKYIEKGRKDITCDNVQDVEIVKLLGGVVEFSKEMSYDKDNPFNKNFLGEEPFLKRPKSAISTETEDKLIELLKLAILNPGREINIGQSEEVVVAESGDVKTQRKEVLEKSENGKKPFLKRTHTLVMILGTIVIATITVLTLWYSLKDKSVPLKPKTVQEAPADTSKADSTKTMADNIK